MVSSAVVVAVAGMCQERTQIGTTSFILR